MDNNVSKEIQLLDYQIIASLLFILSIFISIFLTYEDELEKKGEKRIFPKYFDKCFNLLNRIFLFMVALFIIYINYSTYELEKEQGKNLKPFKQQLLASIIAVIPLLIIISVIIENWNDSFNISNFENLEF